VSKVTYKGLLKQILVSPEVQVFVVNAERLVINNRPIIIIA